MQELDISEVARRSGIAAACPAPSHLECPTFRRLLGKAASGAIAKPGKRRPGDNHS